MGALLLLGGLGLLYLMGKGTGGGRVSPEAYAATKGAIGTAVNADVAAGAAASMVSPGWLDQLAMAWIRGDANEIGGIATYLQANRFAYTAQAFGSRFAQVTGRPLVPAAAPKAA